MRLTAEDHAKVTAAVTAAELDTAGEIVTVVARTSDAYHDVGLHWAVAAMLLSLAGLAAFPASLDHLHALYAGAWETHVPAGTAITMATVIAAIVFLLARYLLAIRALRMALTPSATKTRRVRRRALELFRLGAEKRTTGATGVLLYLSLDEHRAELIAEAAIHRRVAPDVWGHAMAVLVGAVKDGRPGDGMAAAVGEIGVVLAQHFPRADDDVNELPDRLIEL